MYIINLIRAYFYQRKKRKAEAEFMRALYSPTLFTEGQRNYLKSLFPAGWVHMDNFLQEDIFKIALAMTMLGYDCSNIKKMQFCMSVLEAQQIYITETGNPLVLKRG